MSRTLYRRSAKFIQRSLALQKSIWSTHAAKGTVQRVSRTTRLTFSAAFSTDDCITLTARRLRALRKTIDRRASSDVVVEGPRGV